jgi:hypothetical protein
MMVLFSLPLQKLELYLDFSKLNAKDPKYQNASKNLGVEQEMHVYSLSLSTALGFF